jgi:hypothetical protein
LELVNEHAKVETVGWFYDKATGAVCSKEDLKTDAIVRQYNGNSDDDARAPPPIPFFLALAIWWIPWPALTNPKEVFVLFECLNITKVSFGSSTLRSWMA